MEQLFECLLIPLKAIFFCVNEFIRMFNRSDIQIFGLPIFTWIFGGLFLSGMVAIIVHIANENSGGE